MLRRWLHREKVHAIHKHDLEHILKDLGLLDDLMAGAVVCSICGSRLSLDTIQYLYMEENEVKLCCTKIDCYERLLLEKGATRAEP